MSVCLSDELRDALASNKPVVALETAVLTTGLPRIPWDNQFGKRPDCIASDEPINGAVAKAMSEVVRDNGAVPAWIGVLRGTLHIGLTPEEIQELASDENSTKVSLSNFAHALQNKTSAGTTVSSTLLACHHATLENPIRVFATGGIGGVHKNWNTVFDVSADLKALSTFQTCVVSSGAKSILDIPATVEALETLGVPILGFEQNRFPSFIEHDSEDAPQIQRVDSTEEIAAICKKHWHVLGLQSGLLATVSVPKNVAVEHDVLSQAMEDGERAWAKSNQPSIARTPFLLNHISVATCGSSLLANVRLLCNNAKVASQIATAMRVSA